MRALTSCRVTRSRAAMLARSTLSSTAAYASMTPSGTGTPRSRCAARTASHSRRSARTFSSGDQIRTSSGDAYRAARTVGGGCTLPSARCPGPVTPPLLPRWRPLRGEGEGGVQHDVLDIVRRQWRLQTGNRVLPGPVVHHDLDEHHVGPVRGLADLIQ